MKEKRVVAIRTRRCEHGDSVHVDGVKLDNDSTVLAADVIAIIKAGGVFSMIPPSGSPAHAAHVATGLPLLLQVRECEDCGEEVLFA